MGMFLQNKTKLSNIWKDFHSKISKHLKFVIFPNFVRIDVFKQKKNQTQALLKEFMTNFDAEFDFFFNFCILLRLKLSKTQKKNCRNIFFPKLVTTVSFQKGLNPQIGENKEIHKDHYKIHRVKLTWFLGLYM